MGWLGLSLVVRWRLDWALHQGVQASRSELLVSLDADTEPGPQFLKRLLTSLKQHGGLMSVPLGPACRCAPGSAPISWPAACIPAASGTW